jgi:hypothetical protein
MKKTPTQLFNSVEKIAHKVKQEFKEQGIIIPSRDKKGNVVIGRFTVAKRKTAYYIVNQTGVDVVGPINLVETAVVIANDMALGRLADSNLLNSDRWYGWKSFEAQNSKTVAEIASKKKDYDRAEINAYRAEKAQNLVLHYKQIIDSRFNKLRKLT